MATQTILVTGKTYHLRQAFRAMGGRWDATHEGWIVPEQHAAEVKRLVAAPPIEIKPVDAPKTKPVDAPKTKPVDVPKTKPVDAPKRKKGAKPMIEKTPWNLDAMAADDVAGLALGLRELECYARNKAEAMRARLAGKIDEATSLEAKCDRIFERLPDWARW